MRFKLFGIILMIFSASFCQEMTVKGAFVQDSLRIGEPIEYWLSATYPDKYDLVLPDSNFNFSPFEFSNRQYFETTSKSGQAIDSVIYSLQSFEIDSTQYLNLPALLILNRDTMESRSPIDSITLIHLVPVANDTVRLITNTELQGLPRQVNSPLLMIIGGGLILISLFILLIFGKKIRKHFKLKRLEKSHSFFVEQMDRYIGELKNVGESAVAENAINLWKGYIEKVENRPFTKLTSKEITQISFAEELIDPLKAVDRCVYGKLDSEKVYHDFQHLEDFAKNRYETKVNEIKEAK